MYTAGKASVIVDKIVLHANSSLIFYVSRAWKFLVESEGILSLAFVREDRDLEVEASD